MENMALNPAFWWGRTVFVTGHTGFKGSWLLMLLKRLGADVTGFALAPPTVPSMFAMVDGAKACTNVIGDIRNASALQHALRVSNCEIVLHLAAQPLVRESYEAPVENYTTNVMGTVNLLDACRHAQSVKTVIVITTDKCYENDGRNVGYQEEDRLGGHDPYSNSKACAELVTACYRDSFLTSAGIGVASARAGNVIGGGDYAKDRLVPDAIRALTAGRSIELRNPHAVRPWQHVLEPLLGYLRLAEALYRDPDFAGGWNFGPAASDMAEVGTVATMLAKRWSVDGALAVQPGDHPHEASLLTLDSKKAAERLNWTSRLTLAEALGMTAEWYKAALSGTNMSDLTMEQIDSYMKIPAYG